MSIFVIAHLIVIRTHVQYCWAPQYFSQYNSKGTKIHLHNHFKHYLKQICLAHELESHVLQFQGDLGVIAIYSLLFLLIKK